MRSAISSVATSSLPVAAALGAHLVLNMHGSRPGLDHGADGAGDVERSAPAGVDVDQQRKVDHIGNPPNIRQHIFHGADAEVGYAERVGCHASPGQIQGAEAGSVGQARRISIDGAGHLQRPFLGHGKSKTGSGRVRFKGVSHASSLGRIIAGIALDASQPPRPSSPVRQPGRMVRQSSGWVRLSQDGLSPRRTSS
jgi:hypothetical protein